jgi:two-component system, OmpR family, response regulator
MSSDADGEPRPGEGAISVLLVEDDQPLAELTAKYLGKRGVIVTLAPDGPSGLAEALRRRYDVVLLDHLLPGKNGDQVCRELRARSDVPIIMVTALGDESERVLGLELGADDYVTKPFSSPELLARIRAVVRRARGQAGPSSGLITVGRLQVDPGAHRATIDGQPVELTGYEFAILRALAERAGRVLSRDQLLELAKSDPEEAFDRSIDGHISRLRRKLGDDPRHPRLLKTIRGAGYLLVAEEKA